MIKYTVISLCFFLFSQQAKTQFLLTGKVVDSRGLAIEDVAIQVINTQKGTTTNKKGQFFLRLQDSGRHIIEFSHIDFNPTRKIIFLAEKEKKIEITLIQSSIILEEIDIEIIDNENNENTVSLRSTTIKNIAAPLNDISNVLASLPSVVSNNELSSSYSVRGGNYDENIVQVNGIYVYRPFLVRSGQQEGLSFINTDLLESVSFSAGGWDATSGGKMSSLLRAKYKAPKHWIGGVKLSLIGASGYLGGTINKSSFLLGIRSKQSKYLLNTLDLEGKYDPRFIDIQNFCKIPIGKNILLETLFLYASNIYNLKPEKEEISFGTLNQNLRFLVYFEGYEKMHYTTIQEAVKLSYKASRILELGMSASYMQTYEIENTEIEGSYFLSDISEDINLGELNNSSQIKGIGQYYKYARNKVDAAIADLQLSGVYTLSFSSKLAIGLSYSSKFINSKLYGYSFTDSIGYATITDVNATKGNIYVKEINAYSQYTFQGYKFGVTTGLFGTKNSLTNSLVISPRLLVTYAPIASKRTTFKIGTGIYRQQPLYRELLDTTGEFFPTPTTQSSWHLVFSNEYSFKWWGRNFTMNTEFFYKKLWNLIPYQFENVSIQYFPQYTAKGYALGFEARIAGEFIKGAESWFSLGVLSTKEKIDGIDTNITRRPTDQRVKLGAIFEDHIPGDSTLRVNMSLQYGSGLPIGFPHKIDKRALFIGDTYTRVDITFSKIFTVKRKHWNMFRVGLGVYNLFDNRNAVNYIWIQDIKGQNFAVPNNLTGRLYNIILSITF